MGTHELMLDPAIRDWVLLPLFLIMFLIGILRNNVTKMMRKDVVPEAEQVKHNNQLMRARRLRANAAYIPHSAFAARKHYFCADGGVLKQKFDAPDPMKAMQDPNVMMNMMQGNMTQMVPQMAMMGMVNYFFSGFVPRQLPSLRRPRSRACCSAASTCRRSTPPTSPPCRGTSSSCLACAASTPCHGRGRDDGRHGDDAGADGYGAAGAAGEQPDMGKI